MATYGEDGIVRYGVAASLEEAADELIRQSLVGVTSMEAKRDILTPWKQKDRLSKEVYSSSGVPDEASFRGIYHRAWNPEQTHLNSRDGVVRANRFSSLSRHVADHSRGEGLGDHLGDAGFDS